MHDLTADQYEKIWEAGEDERASIALRRRYYDGLHDIAARDQQYVDGTQKTNIVSNFIKFGVDLFTGSIAGTPYNVSAIETGAAEDGEEEIANDSPAVYREIATDNSLPSKDVEHLRNALIGGWGIELHEFVDDKVLITARDPLNWMPVWNSDRLLIGAIFRADLDPGAFMGDVLVDELLEIMVVYNDTEIITFHKKKSVQGGRWIEQERIAHLYGQPPIVVFQTNEARSSLIGSDLLGQQDEYNEIDSLSGDDIRYDSDGVLTIVGYSAKNIQDAAETIREMKLIPLPEGGAAEFIEKPTNFERIMARLTRTRKHIFSAMAVPDIEEITGATGSTSGIALQLKFKPMKDNAQYMITNLRDGVRARIKLINKRLGQVGGEDQITDVQVNISFDLPANRIEEWKSVAALTGIVSSRKQLEVLSDVEDPDQEERRLAVEAEDSRFIDSTSGTPEEVQAVNDAEISARAVELQPQISVIIDSISDAVLAETTRRIP
jgi:hypothetical protein